MKTISRAVKGKIIDNIYCSQVCFKKDGTILFRKGFFYRNNYDEGQYAESISNKLQELNIPCEIIDQGEIWKSFKGGASVANQSHWYVKVKLV